MERFGFVGLPNAGKSSLFNALTGAAALTASYPFTTTESNVASAKVADHRLDALAEMSNSRKVVPATVELVDIGGLAAGANDGEGLGNRFLAGIREVDAVVYVLRAFDDADVLGSTDPLEQLQTLELELCLVDLATVDAQLPRKAKAAKLDKTLGDEVAALQAAQAVLGDGVPLYRAAIGAEHLATLKAFFLLTYKPVLAVLNVGEDDLDDLDTRAKAVADELGGHAEVLALCVQLEAEAAQLDASERREMLEGLGLGEGALPRLVRAAYQLLGRRTFLTTGDKESRAWTFRVGARAPECAGVIHSDLQRGFIRAEVIRWDELLDLGSWTKAKEVGILRVEGKDYEVKDGDVLEIRFNV